MSIISIEELKASYDEKFKTIFNNLQKVETTTNNIHELALSINNVANSVKILSEQTKKNTEDIENIMQTDAKKYKYLMQNIGSLILGAIITFALKKVGLL